MFRLFYSVFLLPSVLQCTTVLVEGLSGSKDFLFPIFMYFAEPSLSASHKVSWVWLSALRTKHGNRTFNQNVWDYCTWPAQLDDFEVDWWIWGSRSKSRQVSLARLRPREQAGQSWCQLWERVWDGNLWLVYSLFLSLKECGSCRISGKISIMCSAWQQAMVK